jgi:hypothetical protein
MANANEGPVLKDILLFLSPEGQKQIVEFIHRAKRERGSRWLPYIKAEFPMATWIIDLAANKTADEALEEVKQAYPTLPVWIVGNQIRELHATLRREIDRPR